MTLTAGLRLVRRRTVTDTTRRVVTVGVFITEVALDVPAAE